MADHSTSVGLSLGEVAERLGAQLHGDAAVRVHRVATLVNAKPGAISFLANRRYRPMLGRSKASAIILSAEFLDDCPVPALVMDNPYVGYALVASLLHPPSTVPGGVHERAWVSPESQVAQSAWVGAGGVVQADASVGARTYIGPGCVVGRGTTVGDDSRLVANVTLCDRVTLGDRVLCHPGVVIGADGFGIANDNGVWIKVPQIGGVRIGNDVEIGANSTVDRGALDDTVLEDGVKLDNLIQIGHNVHVGAHTAIAACVAVGGSAKIGARCTIGGAASIAGHLEIADDVHLTATSAVPNSIREPGVYSSGMPIQENSAWRRNVIRMRQLDEYARRLRTLEKKVDGESSD